MSDGARRGGSVPVVHGRAEGARRGAVAASTGAGEGRAMAAYHACDLVRWLAVLNLLWIGFTLLGGVVLGAGPATVAAHALARRRLRGESFGAVRAFWGVWRAEFARANVLLLPVAVLAVLLWMDVVALGATPAAAVLEGLVVVAAGLLAAVYAVLVPLYVHYELPLRSYPVVAARFVLAHPAAALLLLGTAAGIVLVTTTFPGLLPFLSVGTWIHLDTALCLSFFARNDERVAAGGRARDEQRSSR